MHRGHVKKGQRVVLIDDLIATGGTLAAGIKLMMEVWGSCQTPCPAQLMLFIMQACMQSVWALGRVHRLAERQRFSCCTCAGGGGDCGVRMCDRAAGPEGQGQAERPAPLHPGPEGGRLTGRIDPGVAPDFKKYPHSICSRTLLFCSKNIHEQADGACGTPIWLLGTHDVGIGLLCCFLGCCWNTIVLKRRSLDMFQLWTAFHLSTCASRRSFRLCWH